MRRLIGSNCVRIETGVVSDYYTCLGCIIEEAIGCIDDMRLNRSGNVHPHCDMAMINEVYESDICCPMMEPDFSGRLDLTYSSSAYPETLRCIQNVGCSESTIYKQLLDECLAVCPSNKFSDQYGGPACFANFNHAFPIFSTSTYVSIVLLAYFVVTLMYLL